MALDRDNQVAVEMWRWADIDENRRRIRYNTLEKAWEWVTPLGVYHTARENSFSGAVIEALAYDMVKK